MWCNRPLKVAINLAKGDCNGQQTWSFAGLVKLSSRLRSLRWS